MLKPLIDPSLAALPGIAHGFFTRHGGVSQGIYAALNCGPGSGDDAAAVASNRERVRAQLGASELLSLHQVHGREAILATCGWPNAARPKADGIVTARRSLAVTVLTADCAPVLLAEPEARVVAAAHAGWRGALAGILEATVAAMEGLGARRERITAAVGPAIGPTAYEVGWDFQRTFLDRDPASQTFFSVEAATARPHFNLPGYVADRLCKIGVTCRPQSMPCTFTQTEDLFSYRRSQRLGEADYGRQISAIVLT
jgi:polyphenol oxidase